MKSCVFCRILGGGLDGSFVFRGKKVSAFMDLHPVNAGHVLVVPNEHAERFLEIPPAVAGELFQVAQKILGAIETSSVKCDGANLFLSDGEVAGQEVPHSHLHIVPRFTKDGHRMGFSQTDADAGTRAALEKIAGEISAHLD